MRPNIALSTLCVLSLVTTLAPTGASSDALAPVLVELQPNPVGTDRGNEWVELANAAPVDLPLDGLFLTERAGATLALSGTVPALGRLVVALPGSFALNNGGDTVTLYLLGPTGEPVVLQSVSYGSDGDFDAPGEGESLSACEFGAGIHGGNWTAGPATPGASNAACPL